MVDACDVVPADSEFDAPDPGGEEGADDDEVGEVAEEDHEGDG